MKRTADEQLADIAQEFVRQNKSKYRWRIIFSILFVSYFIFISYIGVSENGVLKTVLKKESPFVAEVVLSGIIQSSGSIDADETIELLHSAFKLENAKAIILRINSPGGSPVQSSRIYKAIIRLKKQFDKKFYVVVEDVCASGCYYIASAADEIYADESSIIGSIGVIMSSFGAVDAIKKLGIKRRLYTAGKYKGLLDSFSPENEKILAHIQTHILDKLHQNFINAVKAGRGNRLSKHKDLFTGLIWLGQDANKLGLIDGIADTNYVAKHIIGIDSRVLFEKEKTLLEQLTEASINGIALAISDKLISKNLFGFLQIGNY
ncbi:MAG: S49 family peptidase [Candidatus Vesicomyosocius endoextente]|uniref:S49 family peptidase n=1 Tax=Candidatus Vesicomyosocius endoextente TaxID=2738853 RepID=A0A853G109_9GAMM|nr:S49 family peptidase [Candidatus Vesicomyosocius endoextente]